MDVNFYVTLRYKNTHFTFISKSFSFIHKNISDDLHIFVSAHPGHRYFFYNITYDDCLATTSYDVGAKLIFFFHQVDAHCQLCCCWIINMFEEELMEMRYEKPQISLISRVYC